MTKSIVKAKEIHKNHNDSAARKDAGSKGGSSYAVVKVQDDTWYDNSTYVLNVKRF